MLKGLKLKNIFKKSSKVGNILKVVGTAVLGTSVASDMEPNETVEIIDGVEKIIQKENIVVILEKVGEILGTIAIIIGQLTGRMPKDTSNSNLE